MGHLIFLTHPQVVVEPEIPVTHWGLSQEGKAALEIFLRRNIWPKPQLIWSSNEVKAQQAAALVSRHYGCAFQTHAGLGENDRTATGYLPANEFEAVADQFFAHPEKSTRGWERAVDAQTRIVRALSDIIREAGKFDHQTIMIAGHGATGTLLYCALADLAISRQYDQPSQGHYWSYDFSHKHMLHDWRSIHR